MVNKVRKSKPKTNPIQDPIKFVTEIGKGGTQFIKDGSKVVDKVRKKTLKIAQDPSKVFSKQKPKQKPKPAGKVPKR